MKRKVPSPINHGNKYLAQPIHATVMEKVRNMLEEAKTADFNDNGT
jgi:hypothetical protein